MKHFWLTTCFFYLLLCLLPNVLPGQTASYFPNIQYITSDDGLSQSEVTCILQDQKGFLWIGTRGGLNRYDGHNFKVFQNEIGNTNSLINNSIESLFEDKEGNIWIGTKSNGVSKYSPRYDHFSHLQHNSEAPNSISGNRIISIAESPSGNIWLGTWENGLNILDPKNGKIKHLLGQTKIGGIIQTQDGKMWLATSIGLLCFNQNGDQLKSYNPSQGATVFVSLIEDRQTKKLYLGTWRRGVYEFDPSTGSFHQFVQNDLHSKSISSNNAYHLYQDRKNRIWVGTWGGGLNLFHPESQTFSHYDLSQEGKKGSKELYLDALCVFQDQSGILWIGTNGGGLCKIDENTSQFGLLHQNQKNSVLPNEPVWSVLKDREKVLWVSTKGNGSVFYSTDGNSFFQLSMPIPFPRQMHGHKEGIKIMYQSQDGSLWFASKTNLFKVEKNNDTYEAIHVLVKDRNKPPANRLISISALYQTTDGFFWIGTQQEGLRKSLAPGIPLHQEFQHYLQGDQAGDLKNNRISVLLEDQTKRLWIGTYGGLHLYQAESDDFLHFSKEQGDVRSLSSDIIICLHEDMEGNLWIGTPNGLNVAVPDGKGSWSFKCFQEKDGLPNNYIHAILEDDTGHLWISTNKGISKFDPDELAFFNYDVVDGLQSNSFMEGAAFKDTEGMLYFGGIYGVNYFYPDSISNTQLTPPVVLTSLKIFNQTLGPGEPFDEKTVLKESIEYSKKVSLTHKMNVFSIEYAALDFQSASKNVYRYKMEGLEENWNLAGNQRSVTYNNLRPGQYTFQVQVMNNIGKWDNKGANLEIEVLPPFWATKMAICIYVLAFGGLLFLYRHIIGQQNQLKNKLALARLEQKQEVEMAEMKTRFFTNITHELRTPLTLISGPIEEILEKENLRGRLKSYLMTVHHHTQRLSSLVNQLLDFRKAESGHMSILAAEGDFVKFSKEVFLSFQELAGKNEIDFKYTSSHPKIPLYFDRDKMEIVLCNLLSNAFKYSPANSTIQLSIRQISRMEAGGSSTFPNGYCEISVKDNGQGMPEELVANIFDRFYQIAKTDSVKLVGTGIGLSLVKNIIELHHGQIQVQSELGTGSKFTSRLHLGRTHFSEEQLIAGFKDSEHPSHYLVENPVNAELSLLSNATNGTNNKSCKLLIVEDNSEIRDFIRKIFAEDFILFEAEDGKNAINIAKAHTPDLIISDIMMPKMDGLTFCRKIKDDDELAHIPVILLTARTATVFQIEGFHSGADAYITKPFHPRVLKAQVANLLEARKKLKEYFSKIITLEPSDIEITSQDEQFLKQVMELVETNLNNEALSREFLAQAMAMSSSTFYRKIKTLTGFTTNAFIRTIRLKRAAQMMRDTQFNISEIAYQVGFNDLKYFRTCFKEQFGMNPSAYIAHPVETE